MSQHYVNETLWCGGNMWQIIGKLCDDEGPKERKNLGKSPSI